MPADTTLLLSYRGRCAPSRLTHNLTKAYEQIIRVEFMASEAADQLRSPSTGAHKDIASRCIAAWASHRNETWSGAQQPSASAPPDETKRFSKAA